MNTENENTTELKQAVRECCKTMGHCVEENKSFDRTLPFIVCGVIAAIIIIAWLTNSRTAVKPPSPIQSTQITMFNVGACQYVLVGQDKALAVVHRGDCTNHTTQDFYLQ